MEDPCSVLWPGEPWRELQRAWLGEVVPCWVLWAAFPCVLQLGTRVLGTRVLGTWTSLPRQSPGSPSLLPIQQPFLSPVKRCVPRALLSGRGIDVFFRHC